jgi:hypothetical protein
MMMTFMGSVRRHPQQDDLALGRPEDVGGDPAELEFTEWTPVRDADDDRIGPAFHGLVDDGMACIASLQQVAFDLEVLAASGLLGLCQDFFTSLSFGREVGVQRQSALHLDDVDDMDLSARSPRDSTGKLHGHRARFGAVHGHEDGLEGKWRFFGFYGSVVTAKHAQSPAIRFLALRDASHYS